MRHLLKLSIPAIAASILLAACGSSSSSNTTSSTAVQTSEGTSSAIVVKSASSSLGTILVNGEGMTLYRLSGEIDGKFICTSTACMSVWHPLVAPANGAPKGQVPLGTVKRPEGTLQVTYQGAPLYTFAQDKHPGEADGQRIKDVGTWSVLRASSTSTAPSTGGSSETEKSGGGSSSGGYSY